MVEAWTAITASLILLFVWTWLRKRAVVWATRTMKRLDFERHVRSLPVLALALVLVLMIAHLGHCT